MPWIFVAAAADPENASISGAAETATADKTPPKEIAAPPFSIGERLLYVVEWDPPWYLFFLPTMDAGELDLQLQEEALDNDRKALKITFKAYSSGILSKLAGVEIEDVFVFHSEPETFCSLKTSKSIREGKRKRQIDVEYFRDRHRLHIREVDESVVPPKLKKDAVKENIPACVYNPLSAIYLLRQAQLRTDHVCAFVIGYDDKIREVESRVEKQESIKTPAGEFTAWQIRTAALMGGLFKEGGQFRIWLSADERKLPLQFEVKVKLGKVLGKLKQEPASGKDPLEDLPEKEKL
jgi:hypothetical protein